VPRSERPIDETEDAVVAFAAGLRKLREKAGRPPYRTLAKQAHYSVSTLADAAAGRKLPSLPVALAYVDACGGDVEGWEQRWREVSAELAEESKVSNPAEFDSAHTCPYIGLPAFQSEDAEWFFGRERLTDELVNRISERRFLAVFGASGSGKSSLLRAGLLPRMRAADHGPAILFTPGPHPIEECAVRLAAFGGGSASALRTDLLDGERALHLIVRQLLAEAPDAQDLLIVVDQFEEVFTLCADERERSRFIDALLTAAGEPNSRCRVVIGCRADFYVRCAEHPNLVDALRDAQVLVGPMTTDELRKAVSLPAARAEATVEGALLARIIAEATGEANVLPLVSHALRETWRRRRGNTLTLAGYEASGGIQHALARTAEHVYGELTAAQQQLARGIFLRLVALDEDTTETKRRLARAELDADDPNTAAVLGALAGARLITLDIDTVELTHEALLHAWPRLHGWISADRAGLLLHQQFADAAVVWEREDRDPSALYRGARLAAVTDWAQRHEHDVPLSPRTRAFLAASIRGQRRNVGLRRGALVLLCVLTVLASIAATVAFSQSGTASAERDNAIAGQILSESEQLRATDPSLAAQLALTSYRMQSTAQSTADLLSTENVPLSRPLTGHIGTVYAVAYRPDGKIMASAGADDTIRLWNTADPSRPPLIGAPIRAHSKGVYWVAFSPDGRTLASAGADHTVELWNLTDPAHPKPWGAPLTGHTGLVFSVSFSPNGMVLASASDDGTVRLWNVAAPAKATPLGVPLPGDGQSLASATFSPDGRTLAVASHDHTLALWNLTDPAHPQPWRPPLTGFGGTVYAAAFSPDGHTMATVCADNTVQLWNVNDPAQTSALGAPMLGHSDTVYAVAYSPDGRILATAGADQSVRLWDVADPTNPQPLGTPLVGHTGYVFWLAFSPDGHTLASASADHTIRLWNLPRTLLTEHTSYVNGVAFSPNGRIMASGSGDDSVRLWNVANPGRPEPIGAPLTGNTGSVKRVAFSPNGRILASAGADNTVRMWDVNDPDKPKPIGHPLVGRTDAFTSLMFSPNGRTLAAGCGDHSVWLWNVAEPDNPIALGPPLRVQADYVYWTGFSPDNQLLASGSADDTVRLWDMRDPAHPKLLPGTINANAGAVLWGAFSPNGHILATANDDHTVRLWDITDPAHPKPIGAPLTGHTSFVYWVGFSPDGNTLTSSSGDDTVRRWDVSDPAEPATLGAITGHTGPVDNAALSLNDEFLATASDDHTLQITALDPAAAIQRICASTANNLTQRQWQVYVPQQLPYNPPCS
jgi:WD40 repeat protein